MKQGTDRIVICKNCKFCKVENTFLECRLRCIHPLNVDEINFVTGKKQDILDIGKFRKTICKGNHYEPKLFARIKNFF